MKNIEQFIPDEISAYEESIRKANELRDHAVDAVAHIVAAWKSLDIMRTTDFEEIKKRSIEQFRAVRTTIDRESLETIEYILRVNKALANIDTKKLNEFVDVCKKLNELKSSGVFDHFKFN